jgi:hypothetical protein
MIKLSQDSQSPMKGLGVSVFETSSMNHNIAIDLGRDLILGNYNIQLKNGDLASISKLTKN